MSVRILVIGGLEPSGRAGILADVQTLRALGASPIAIASALTAQGTRTFRMEPSPARMVAAQVRAALELGPVHAVKLGMIPDAQVLRALRRALSGLDAPWVVDPVVRSSRGQALSSLRPRDYLALASPRTVITPNVDEAAWLLGEAQPPQSSAELCVFAQAIAAEGFGAAVLKGGHLPGAPTDVVASSAGVWRQSARRLARTPEHRGTGCRFASALAAGVARKLTVEDAVRLARRHVAQYLRAPRSTQ